MQPQTGCSNWPSMKSNIFDLTIVSVATGKYLDYWLKMYLSAIRYLDPAIKIQFIVFTDKPSEVNVAYLENKTTHISVVTIEGRKWPFPTLLRYELINDNSDKILGENVMHLDADMLFVDYVSKDEIASLVSGERIGLVLHPGFYRKRDKELLRTYFLNPKIFISDIKQKLFSGGSGSWETNRNSLAFVHRRKRKEYFCGATWIGPKNKILEMCFMLANRIKTDLENSVIAKFHDESHLNWYATTIETNISDPRYCYDNTQKNLHTIRPKILAVNKNTEFPWVRD